MQISERTDSYLDNIHLGLTLWDGVLKLGAEVESWTANKLAVFTQSPSFQTDEDIRAFKVKLSSYLSICRCLLDMISTVVLRKKSLFLSLSPG